MPHLSIRRQRANFDLSSCAEALEQRLVLATFAVTNINDSGAGSFRDALVQANSATTDDTIRFTLPAGPQTISLLTALPQVPAAGGGLTIEGSGAGLLTLRRDASAPAFGIINSASPRLTITGLTITGGAATTTRGGGIFAGGTTPQLVLDGVVVTGNSATGSGASADGGGIALHTGGFLTLRNSTVSGNTSADDGGGIYFFTGGSLLMENSTVSGNTAGTTVGHDGGGVYFFGTAGASPPAGFTPSTLIVRNSTITNNTAGNGGGGIALRSFTGTLLVQNSTIVANTAAGPAGGASGGGGIGLSGGSGTITLANSVVAFNDGNPGPDVRSASTVNVNFCAIGDALGFTLSATSGNNLPFNTNLRLANLDDNGGPTKTVHPITGSPLINAGSGALLPPGLTTDQRGAGFPRVSGAAVDIGAVEVGAPALVSIAVNGGATQRSQVKTLTLTFDRPVILAAGALKLEQLNTGGSGLNNGSAPTNASAALGTPTTSDGGRTWTYAFVGGNPFMQTGGGVTTGSLVDGIYIATVDATKVTAGGGIPMAAGASLMFHRLFGDQNGNKTTNNADFGLFRGAFLKSTGQAGFDAAFDFENSGVVNNLDFGQFRARFLKTFTY